MWGRGVWWVVYKYMKCGGKKIDICMIIKDVLIIENIL